MAAVHWPQELAHARVGTRGGQCDATALDVDMERVCVYLTLCVYHGWIQTLRCIWRCLESSRSLFDDMKDEALGHVRGFFVVILWL